MKLLTMITTAMSSMGKDSKDIIYIGSINTGYMCTWAEFEQLTDVAYPENENEQVASDLVIVFNDGALLNCSRPHILTDEIDLSVINVLTPDKPKRITSIIVEKEWFDGTTLADINSSEIA